MIYRYAKNFLNQSPLNMPKLVIFILLGLLSVACQSGSKTKPPFNNTYIECKKPRPEVCTEEYLPVCAKKDNGIRCVKAPCPSTDDVTFANACSACADPKVYGYTPGGECK